jgi:hypothetical protein
MGLRGSCEQKAASQRKAVSAPSNLMCFEWEPPFAGGSVDLVDRSIRVFSREAVNPSSTLLHAVFEQRIRPVLKDFLKR